MANQTAKAKKEEKQEEVSLDEQIELLDVPKAVDRTLEHPETGESRTYVQHEMGFLTKLKFFRLVAGTARLATDGQGGIAEFLEETMVDSGGATDNFMTTITQLIELVPDFYQEAAMLILKVPVAEQAWVGQALENISDEEGVDILDVFIAQNGAALRDFFTKHLQKLQKRASEEFGSLVSAEDTEQE
jgi:hypothetical protein